jgi:hypothetical protein
MVHFENTVTTGGFVLLRVLRCGLYNTLLHTDTVNVMVMLRLGKEMLRTGGRCVTYFSGEIEKTRITLGHLVFRPRIYRDAFRIRP